MKVAIMQPYFLPYIGYFQLIKAVDEFIIYDNIEYTKKGWINRNRILVNGVDAYISLPIKKDSDYLMVNERFLAESWDVDKKKIFSKIRESYRKAPFYNQTIEVVEQIFKYDDKNLFGFIYNSLLILLQQLQISTSINISSSLQINHALKNKEKVIALCKSKHAKVYVNPIGGLGLYSKDQFLTNCIELQFIRSNPIEYKQFNNTFVPWLSIIDVMMFNSPEQINQMLDKFTLE